MEPIITRVGSILDADNRFLGRSVYEDWEKSVETPVDGLLYALGVERLDAVNREAFRLLSLCVMSPDARVWPLKLTRLLASWGDPLAGYFGGQLVTAGKVMGPGATTGAAQCLEFVAQAVGGVPNIETVSNALSEWKDRDGVLAGFGVPFRAVDERRAALVRFVGTGPISRRRYWKLHELVVLAEAPTAPNCLLSFAAMLLDAGVAAERCGLAVSVLMPHVFLAHALEAAATDNQLNAWPAGTVKYKGTGPRVTGDARRGEVPRALRREH